MPTSVILPPHSQEGVVRNGTKEFSNCPDMSAQTCHCPVLTCVTVLTCLSDSIRVSHCLKMPVETSIKYILSEEMGSGVRLGFGEQESCPQ